MTETVYTVVIRLRWQWLPGRKRRIQRMREFARELPGYAGFIELIDDECRRGADGVVMLSTAEHGRKAHQAIMYKSVEHADGSVTYYGRYWWMSGKYVFRAEIDREAGELRVMEPADGWDTVDEEDRTEGLPWPPPEGTVTDVIAFETAMD